MVEFAKKVNYVWEQRKLDDWGNFYYGRSCPKWSVAEDATIPCIRYGELYTKFGAKIDKIYSYTNMSPENLRFSNGTEVLIPRVGEDPMDYNRCTWLSMPNVAIGEMISVFNTDNNPLFTATMFNATLQHEFAMRVEGGSVTNLYFDKLKNIEVSFPTKEEQEKIATYFDHLDHLITLHQRKIGIFIKKMPIDWEQRKLGDIAEVTKLAGFEFTEHVVYSDAGNIIALRGLNIKNGQLILDDVKYIDGSNFSKLNRSKLFIDDIMLTYVGTVGEVAIIKENNRFYLAPNVSRIRVQSNDSPKFISHYMRTDNFKNKVIFPLIATSSQPALSMENIRKFMINMPKNRDEQDCLAEYFDHLDHLITLHQHKCDEMKKLKKYMLQKMFPQNGKKVPEIRFDGFTNDWEQRKLSDVVDSVDTGKSKFDKEGSSGEYPILGSTSVIGYDAEYDYEGDFILTARVGANAGSLYRHAGKVKISDNTVFIQASQNIEFLYQLLIRFDIKRLSFGTGQPLVKASELKRLELMMPTDMEEQMRIGVYFKNLDHLITLHQRKCEELKNVKKYMLQNMFAKGE